MREMIDVGKVVDLPGPVEIAVEVYLPEGVPKALLFCYPGGGCNRNYFDLTVAGDDSYSFAGSMSELGYIVLTVDHLGVGESYTPADGLEVTLERLVAANAFVLEQLHNRYGRDLTCIGVGHSMGALLAVLQQDQHRSFSALALLGFSSCGMPEVLCSYGHELAGDISRVRYESVALARHQFAMGYVDIPVGKTKRKSAVESAAYDALSRVRGHLITVPGAFSLVPGCVLEESCKLDLPVFVAVGERDICGSAREIPEQFAADVQLTVLELPDTGHMHFIYESRKLLLNEMNHWIENIAKY